MYTNRVEKIFDAVENNLTIVATRLGSWLAPLPTAFLIWRATAIHLAWPAWIAFVAGIVIELLGLGTVNAVLMFQDYNATRRKSDPQAPLTLALAMAGVYFATVLLLTIALEVAPQVAVLSPALFVGMSLTGAGTLMLRKDHQRRLAAIRQEKAERAGRASRIERPRIVQDSVCESVQDCRVDVGTAHSGVQSGSLDAANASRKQRKALLMGSLLDVYRNDPYVGPTELARRLGISRSTVYNYTAELEAAGQLHKNSHGGG